MWQKLLLARTKRGKYRVAINSSKFTLWKWIFAYPAYIVTLKESSIGYLIIAPPFRLPGIITCDLLFWPFVVKIILHNKKKLHEVMTGHMREGANDYILIDDYFIISLCITSSWFYLYLKTTAQKWSFVDFLNSR